MKLADFDYYLPAELIAQEPLRNRADSRLLVLNRASGEIAHTKFSKIDDYIDKGDCLVINNTKVLPARLLGAKATGAKIEILLLKELSADKNKATWEALIKPGKRLKQGDRVLFNDSLAATIGEITPSGGRTIILQSKKNITRTIKEIGKMPLPPYIKSELQDLDRYQTVYSEKEGSAAAPTAGLHFTEDIITEITNKGAEIATITLNIGLDTFRPVQTENIEDHHIHKEYIELDENAAATINRATEHGGKIIAVGTTAVRTLESCAKDDSVTPYAGETDKFIYPGYKFAITDRLITNFHLPKSTLLMLVSAFAGTENIKKAYREAIELKYRFFSFGDAMLIY